MRTRALLPLALFAALAGCTESAGSTDAETVDSGARDAGAILADASPGDAAPDLDLGAEPDAAPPDLGAAIDAGEADAEPGDSGAIDAGAGDAGVASRPVTLRFQPSYPGVTEVAVVGAFGRADDWTQPRATLTDDGSGTFVGTFDAPETPIDYLFRVRGDAQAAPSNVTRYFVDPTAATVEACPMGAPTYSASMNPCGVLDVTSTSAPTLAHVRGTVRYSGAAIAGYLVLLERVEAGLHHFAVSRQTSGADGRFDFIVAAGQYRVQVLHPSFYLLGDEDRDPLSLLAVRRTISGGFAVGADLEVPPAETAYLHYADLAPRAPSAHLPTSFHAPLEAGAAAMRFDVYGARVGDPYFASRSSTSTEAVFDGMFNTQAAPTSSVTVGRPYWWGTTMVGRRQRGIAWTQQSMVFPITWR